MSRVSVMIAEEVANLLGATQDEIECTALEIIVLELYRRHEISDGRAAEFLKLDLLTCIRWSGERGVPFFDMTLEQWEHEVQSINED